MLEQNDARIRMKRNFLVSNYFDENVYKCSVITYKEDENRLYLVSRETPLEMLSLDSIYECRIREGNIVWELDGVIVDRYRNRLGEVFVLEMKNGFYKKIAKA